MKHFLVAVGFALALVPGFSRADTADVLQGRHFYTLVIKRTVPGGAAARLFTILVESGQAKGNGLPGGEYRLVAGNIEATAGGPAVFEARIQANERSFFEISRKTVQITFAPARELYELLARSDAEATHRDGDEPASWTDTLSSGQVSCSMEFYQGDRTWSCLIGLR